MFGLENVGSWMLGCGCWVESVGLGLRVQGHVVRGSGI